MTRAAGFMLWASIFVFGTLPAWAALPGTRTDATQYLITVKKIELCTSSTCATSVVLGNTTSSFDIASASVGAQIGSYASTSGLPVGTTFTHIGVTLDAAITVTGSGSDGTRTCRTMTTPDVASTVTALGVTMSTANDGNPAEPMSIVIPDTTDGGGGIAGGPADSDYATFNLTKADGGDPFITFALTSSFTVTTEDPLIEVSFDTQNSLVFLDLGGGNGCRIYPYPPVVSITIN